MRRPHRAIHLDFHTMPAVGNVGADFDADEFARVLADAHVEFITVFAKCNLGMAYYPTKVGIVHPSLKSDLLGEMVEACHRREIAVAAYFNCGLDHEMALRHRDWAILRRDGRVYLEDRLSHIFRIMCFGGEWPHHLTAMIEEVLDAYPVDGLFLDSFRYGEACYGYECVAAMRDAGMDPTDDAQVLKFQRKRKIDFITRVRKLIDGKRPQATFFVNGFPFEPAIPFISHFEIEALPAGEWGYDFFPWKVRCLRRSGIHLVRMTGRFHGSWGDFGGLRTQAALDFDCFQAVSHGAAVSVGDHLHPCGKLNTDAYRRIGATYGRLKELEEWTRQAKALTETAVVLGPDDSNRVKLDDRDRHIMGTTRALDEMKQQFDIIAPGDDWSAYELLILLDGVRLDTETLKKVRDHLGSGGAIISTGSGGMLAEANEWPEEWGLEYVGSEEISPIFLAAHEGLCRELSESPLALSGPAYMVRTRDGTQTLADIIHPYFSRRWDGFHGHTYLPPKQPSGSPAITKRGRIIHFAHCVFRDYADNANPLHRALVKAAISQLVESPLVDAPGLPSFARLTLTRQDGRTMVHILSYVPERRTRTRDIVEEPITLRDIGVSLRKERARCVYLAPSRTELAFAARNGRITFTVPEIVGYQMIVAE